ncbi:putrescine/spermidine ABC transporter substrate-binding protein [Rhizobium leguminosarum bv. trifolii CB782]|uniref:Putrescine-binding periplasmic protein n=1 Tax=Rhizobium hidalgonense TaxID=1538159 RepID=A0AAJ2GX38_9HYPH|nr:polyamine ABC transporter substrate-binding protein [Rhizobium hidalgonense]AHG44139.1 putrescine/spermidine ABC transporter substrate-binding protein [Rhizobium leguminosarum bv. trifolii CB782]EJC74156.1 spermidine/putrescine-binding periplasmic protein [Rhizobium leguminosarum bv. trifolii WSM2012]MDR9775585.1 polyamine ABC transporter substrate-binding protein [Rhizobium hidalgonense]MDR9807639.1 polyamine ABC transporter substrate-binding protein [Rhizobium hidalgonense]MDR9812699.1 po
MRSIIPSVTAVAVAALLAAAPAFAQERVVNVYNWSDYIDDSILADFTKETGIKVVYDTFDSNETVETKLLAGGTGYDVVVPTADFLQRQIQAGVFQKLDKSKLPNLSNMWDVIQQRTAEYDPGNEHAVDYMWGTDGIGYNVKKVAEILGPDVKPGLEVIFDPKVAAKFKDCGIYVLDTPKDVITTAFRYLGLDPNSTKAEDFKKAEELLTAVRPNIRKFHSSEYINALANGDICIAFGYSGDMLQARDRAAEAKNGVEVNYSVPPQGAQMWFDMMAIPADAPHVAEAHEFLNYMMKPEVIAKASDHTFYANGNKASQQFVSKDILEDPAVYPTAEVMKNLFTVKPWDPKTQRLGTRLWTKVVTGQ